MKHHFKITMFAAAFAFGAAFGAQAMEPLAPVQQQLFTCGGSQSGITHVSTLDIPQARCCSPNSHCVELLSTTALGHASKANHT